MGDRREQILVRLLGIARATTGIVKAERNFIQPTDRDLPFIGVLEGDEEADEASPIPRSRPGMGPALFAMTPQMVLVVTRGSETLGTDLNTFRTRIIKAVLADEELAAIVGSNGSIRYVGLQSDLSVGRSMLGSYALGFTFVYPLIQSEI